MAFEKVTYINNETVITAEQMNEIQDAIIKNREDISTIVDANGRYYTPTVVDNGDGTMAVTFSASVADMPEVRPVTVDLPQGEKGAKGDTGPAGADGKDGEPGAKGDTGPAGADGKDGADGKSIFYTIVSAGDSTEIAMEMHSIMVADNNVQSGDLLLTADGKIFTVTRFTASGGSSGQSSSGVIASFLFDTKGEPGIQGIQGEKGDTGPAGPQGEKGEQGIQGIQGEPGAKGDKGDTGPAGADGKDGADYVLTDLDKQEIADIILGGAW